MLTKDLLRVRTRSGKVLPEFISADSTVEVALAEELIAAAKQSVGATYGEAKAAIQDLTHGAVKSAAGLAKLVTDRFVVDDVEGDKADQRWKIFLQVEYLRAQSSERSIFEAAAARALQQGFSDLSSQLYSDLTESREIKSFKPIESSALVNRYNSALVQGLLLRAESVQVILKGASLQERRRIFRALRFHRLMPAVGIEGELLTLELGGPLSLFGIANIYGSCIANFIPHLFSCPDWELQASVVLKSKKQVLKLNQKSGLVSHYRKTGTWIPEEFEKFASAFSTRFPDWKVSCDGDPLILGKGDWCLPDFAFKSPKGQILYMELFHRWHAGGLVSRVKKMTESPRKDLIIGVCRQLAKNAEVAKLLQNFEVFKQHGLLFGDFPTPTSAMAILKELAK